MTTSERSTYDFAVNQVRALGFRLRAVSDVKPLKKREVHYRPEPILRRVKRVERAS